MPSRISQMRSGQSVSQPQPQPPQLNEAYINQLKQLMHSTNAMDYLANAFSQNPQLQQVLNMIKNSRNPQGIYETLARQMNVDPNYILNKLMS